MTGAVEGRLAEAWTKVRGLHRPEWLPIAGPGKPMGVFCSCGSWGHRLAWWECPTALVVYTDREVAAALAGTPPQTEDSE